MRIFLASLLRLVSPNTCDNLQNSALVSSLVTLVVPLSACNTAFPLSPTLSTHSFIVGINGFKSTCLLLTASEICAFCSSSLLLSICTARASRLLYMVVTNPIIGSALDNPVLASSDESSFFIQSSGDRLVSTTELFPLYFANRSLPLYNACCFRLPFCAISAKYDAGSTSLVLPSADMFFTPKCKCSPVVRVPVFPDTPNFCPAFTSSPTFTAILSKCIYVVCTLLPSDLAYSTVTDLPPPVLALWFTATTLPPFSVANTSSCLALMSMPLCICCLLLSIGS